MGLQITAKGLQIAHANPWQQFAKRRHKFSKHCRRFANLPHKIGTRIICRYSCTHNYVRISMFCVSRCHRCFLLIIHMKQKHLRKDPFSYIYMLDIHIASMYFLLLLRSNKWICRTFIARTVDIVYGNNNNTYCLPSLTPLIQYQEYYFLQY